MSGFQELLIAHRAEIEATTIASPEELLARSIALGESALLQMRSHYEMCYGQDPTAELEKAKVRLINDLPAPDGEVKVGDLLVHAMALIEVGLCMAEGYGDLTMGTMVADLADAVKFAASNPNWESFGG